jgi:hypothetical protein
MNKEQVIARLEYWKKMLHVACGDRANKSKSCVNPLTYAETIQRLEEDEDIKDYFNINIVFYKDLEYKWQYEIRVIIDECMFISYKHKEINVFEKFFETRFEAQKTCAEHLIILIGRRIDRLNEIE